MKKTYILPALCALIAMSIAACEKYSNAPRGTYSSSAEVFNKLAVQPTTFTINGASGGSFYSTSGTHYTFSPNSFIDASGAVITGEIKVQVSEFLSKGDMLFSKALPISNNEPILSGGEINVSATHNGQQLFLAPGKPFTAGIPQNGPIAPNMQLFINHPVNGNINWVPDGSHEIVQVHGFAGADTLNIISDSLTMCNADAFMSNPDMQSFKVTPYISGITLTGYEDMFAYALYDSFKGVWPIGTYTGSYSGGVFSEHHVPNIPVHFAVFTLINGNFYGGILKATPHNDSNYRVQLIRADADSFKQQLNGL